MDRLNIKVVGCGGVGCCVLNVLPMYLSYSDYDSYLTLIDGDKYEDKNKARQSFGRLGNKAEVKAEEISEKYPNVFVTPTSDFITKVNIRMLVKEDDVVLSCVDNHATRKLISDRCEKLKNVCLISGGNEYDDGNVQIHIRKDGENITPPITYCHPEIGNPPDRNPGERSTGCDQQVVSTPQLVFMNNMIASSMLSALYGYLHDTITGDNFYDEVYVYLNKNKAIPTRKGKK